jgi:hypothetical protein
LPPGNSAQQRAPLGIRFVSGAPEIAILLATKTIGTQFCRCQAETSDCAQKYAFVCACIKK